MTENEAKKFLKFLKLIKYNVVKQLHKQVVLISILTSLLSSKTHCNGLLKVLNESYVVDNIFVNKLDHLVNNLNANNFIFFNFDEIPLRGMRPTKALQITTHLRDIHYLDY